MTEKAIRKPTTSYYEVVLTGPHELIHGLLTGLSLGAGHEPTIIYAHDAGIADPGAGKKLKELLHIHSHECPVILDGATRGLLKRKAKRIFVETGIEVVSDRKIRNAEFKFCYKAYAPRYAEEIAEILATLPKGAKLVSHKHTEKIDPKAKGAEGYTPVHDYEVKGGGEIRGRFDGVFGAHMLLDRHPLVEVDEIELELV